jgi:hypothetical protein
VLDEMVVEGADTVTREYRQDLAVTFILGSHTVLEKVSLEAILVSSSSSLSNKRGIFRNCRIGVTSVDERPDMALRLRIANINRCLKRQSELRNFLNSQQPSSSLFLAVRP